MIETVKRYFFFIARFPSPFLGGTFPRKALKRFISILKSACSSLK